MVVTKDLSLFCPRKSCPAYQQVNNNIIKCGTYTTKADPIPRQLFLCERGEHKFSETRYSELFGKHGSFKEFEQTAKLTTYGLHTYAIADVIGKDSRTIAEWQKAIGRKSMFFHEYMCSLFIFIIANLQMDEIWSYLRNKSKQLWLFIGLESNTKFWINFELGSRTKHTANHLVMKIKSIVHDNAGKLLSITTDKLSAYASAIRNIFKGINYAYLQIVKRRYKRQLVTVKKLFIKGSSQDFLGKTQNTSYVERFNLTLRMRISFLTRKTLGYCKKKYNFMTSIWINLFDYNYRKYHKGLRERIISDHVDFRKECEHFTPAMRKGMTTKPLEWRYLFTVPIPKSS